MNVRIVEKVTRPEVAIVMRMKFTDGGIRSTGSLAPPPAAFQSPPRQTNAAGAHTPPTERVPARRATPSDTRAQSVTPRLLENASEGKRTVRGKKRGRPLLYQRVEDDDTLTTQTRPRRMPKRRSTRAKRASPPPSPPGELFLPDATEICPEVWESLASVPLLGHTYPSRV